MSTQLFKQNTAERRSRQKPGIVSEKAKGRNRQYKLIGFPDGSFRSQDKVTRAQAAVVLNKSLRVANAVISANAGTGSGWCSSDFKRYL